MLGSANPRLLIPKDYQIHLLTILDAVEKIDDEWNLGDPKRIGSKSDIDIKLQVAVSQTANGIRVIGNGVTDPSISHTPEHARHALCKHGLKGQVHEDKGTPKVNPSPEFAHVAPRHLGIPEIDARDEGEDRAWGHHIMKVPDHVVSIVEKDVTVVET